MKIYQRRGFNEGTLCCVIFYCQELFGQLWSLRTRVSEEMEGKVTSEEEAVHCTKRGIACAAARFANKIHATADCANYSRNGVIFVFLIVNKVMCYVSSTIYG
jgi:hypothetical protein